MRNIIFICMAILLVTGSFVFAEYRNKEVEDIYIAPEINVVDNSEVANMDTDEDGARDWEEVLVGTDPYDPRSVPDKSQNKPETIKEDLTQNTEDIEPIDATSREFFARYMQLRELGVADDANKQDLINNTINSIEARAPALYKENEILIKNDTSIEVVERYGKEIKGIFDRYVISSRNEAYIAKEAIETENPELLKEIDPIINSYKNILNSLLKVYVPKSMKIMHLDLVNSINTGLFIAQAMRKADVDPTFAIQGASYYLSGEEKFRNAIKAINSYFIYLGIYETPF